jgi:hypothetical protein
MLVAGAAVCLATIAILLLLPTSEKHHDEGAPPGPAVAVNSPGAPVSVKPGDPAPDLSKIMPLIDDDFSNHLRSQFSTIWDQKTGNEFHFENRLLSSILAGNLVGSHSSTYLTSLVTVCCAVDSSFCGRSDGETNGRYVMRKAHGSGIVVSRPNQAVEGDFACEVVGRARPEGARSTGWGMALFPFQGERLELAVWLVRGGYVEVGTVTFQPEYTYQMLAQPIRHESIQEIDKLNSLLVVMRGGQWLEIYVNGTAITVPIKLERRLPSGVSQRISSWSRQMEFTRFRLWLLPSIGWSPETEPGNRAPARDTWGLLYDDHFTDRGESVFREGRDEKDGFEGFFENHLYVIRQFSQIPPGESGNHHSSSSPPDALRGDLACEVEGRIVTDGDNVWGVGFFTPNRDRSVGIRIRRDGAVEVGNFLWGQPSDNPVTNIGPIRRRFIHPGEEFNTILLILRGGKQLEIYVNGRTLIPPITLPQPLAPVFPAIQLWERAGHGQFEGRAEFKRFTLWRLPAREKP